MVEAVTLFRLSRSFSGPHTFVILSSCTLDDFFPLNICNQLSMIYLCRCLVTASSLAVLAVSNRYPVDDWPIKRSKVKPQSLVAAMSATSNALLGYAFLHGVAIRFWRHALSRTTVCLSSLLSLIYHDVAKVLSSSYSCDNFMILTNRWL